ncbi:MAG TPA: CDP-alcohol phosphatidyltransferase family protein [Patescibacteria group bacterium]|nr:CDP-alcohol phosphatidyltransferase family protein [Patescibacteria group bacterium]
MSASAPQAPNLRRGESMLPAWVKEGGRAVLAPVVRLAMALHLTPNTITVIGLLITLVASVLVASGWLILGAAILTAGSLLDAVDGALARATGGGTPFGSFLDSTLDRAGEAILYTGIGVWVLRTQPDPVLPMLALMVALAGSFLVSYAHARAQGIGLAADIGLAPRTERLVLVIAGIALAGLGLVVGLYAILAILATLTVATVIQRIRHVWRLSGAPTTDSKEN